MSAAEGVSADPRGSPAALRRSRSSRPGLAVPCDVDLSRRSSSSSPVAGRSDVYRPRRRSGGSWSQAGPALSTSGAPWDAVMAALAELREDVNTLKVARLVASPAPPVIDGAGTSTGQHRPSSPAYFSGFHDSASDGESVGQDTGGSALLQAAKAFGPADQVSADIDPKVAEMVNFVFDSGLREDDYKEDDMVKRPANCPALALVDCNPQVLEALRTDAKKANFRLKDVNKDIQRAATIIVKSLLRLDKVVQDEGHSVLAHEVGLLNGALALLGNANIARRFVMKRELNQKYAYLCSDKVPISQCLFGDDVSLSAKQIEDTEKLKNKITMKKPVSAWKFAGGRSRGVWGRPAHRGWSSRVHPYVPSRPAFRSGLRSGPSRQDTESKNGRGRSQYRPRP
ncbi:uncharacterized protein LOC123517182 [Portunus trituberculatus]|uniref:uncharacterized protein LOC123517182 n=1 Tax=Portunus trituberculatus TaxID=210409 RepID=UPI001E1CF87D|nr:uncharacterized protein LOC123517182 [Portunus trituberculatus]